MAKKTTKRAKSTANARRRARASERAPERARMQLRQMGDSEIPFGLRKTIESCDGTYDEDIAVAVLERVAEGLTLKDACVQLDVKVRWIREWILRNEGEDNDEVPPVPGMRDRYELARRMQAESWGDEIIKIADDATDDDTTSAKLKIDTRKWLMGKNSARFSDKSTVVHEGSRENPLFRSADDVKKELAERGIPIKSVYGDN